MIAERKYSGPRWLECRIGGSYTVSAKLAGKISPGICRHCCDGLAGSREARRYGHRCIFEEAGVSVRSSLKYIKCPLFWWDFTMPMALRHVASASSPFLGLLSDSYLNVRPGRSYTSVALLVRTQNMRVSASSSPWIPHYSLQQLFWMNPLFHLGKGAPTTLCDHLPGHHGAAGARGTRNP
jgi:hypothetical protein